MSSVLATNSAATEAPPHPPIAGYYNSQDEKSPLLRRLFDDAADDYDRIEHWMSFGTGPTYRRRALERAGLVAGKRVLDVAAGTGLVTREAVGIVGDPSLVLGVDPSPGMLAQARQSIPSVKLSLGSAESLPVADASVDFISMGYALRHVSDLGVTFREFHRVIRSGGRMCVLEITRPAGRLHRLALRMYLHGVVPALARLASRGVDSRRLWSYYSDTIENCVPPERIIDAMKTAGFEDVGRHVELGIFSAYTGRRV